MVQTMTGAEYIAEFLVRVGVPHVHGLTGGACAFILDAIARNPRLNYFCYHSEQSAAMAADAQWRVMGVPGVSIATSGPGATNLITGIASSYFDSIPSIHITGQVNQRESSAYHGAAVRQSGFQETKIVEIVRPITKYAVMVRSTDELREELAKAYSIAISSRMGPVLVDVPMDVQQAQMATKDILMPQKEVFASRPIAGIAQSIQDLLESAKRPVVLWGGGVGLAGVAPQVAQWLQANKIPFVSSWAGLNYFDQAHPEFVGQIGVYGNRGANFVLQNADTVLVLGSRLDNRQRSGNSKNFATGAKVHVLDVDEEELKKYANDGYTTEHLDFVNLPAVLPQISAVIPQAWRDYVTEMKTRFFGKETSTSAARLNSLSPYDVVRRIRDVIDEDAIVIGDTGAAVCWLHQAFKVSKHSLFTAGGNSPMGYALPAAIGAKLAVPGRQVISFNGDGGFHLNIQELQTLKHHNLNVAVVVMNNGSYGIIKQFQDSYLDSRYHASRDGYSVPDFGRVAQAYGIGYARIERLDDLTPELFSAGPVIVDVQLSEHTLIEPKLEMGRPINDQYPYLTAEEYADCNRYVEYPRPAPRNDTVR